MKWDTVSELQRFLKDHGKYAGMIDGDFGPATLAALDAIQESGPMWMDVARAEYGVSEIYGSRHNPRILEYHRSTSLKATTDEVPWCASVANWVLERCSLIGTNLANARSFLKWGRHVEPTYGAIAILRRGAPPSGHVAFWVAEIGDRIYLLGGNQGNQFKVSSFPKSDLLDTRWPA